LEKYKAPPPPGGLAVGFVQANAMAATAKLMIMLRNRVFTLFIIIEANLREYRREEMRNLRRPLFYNNIEIT